MRGWYDLSKDELVQCCKEFDASNALLRGTREQAMEESERLRAALADIRVYRWHATYNAALSKLAVCFPEHMPVQDDPEGVTFGETIHAACVAHADYAHGELAK